MLRDYQEKAISEIREKYRKTKKVLLISPTGTGKTVIFSDIARRVIEKGGKVLVLVHRIELAKQAIESLIRNEIDARLLKLHNGMNLWCDAFVATIQSMQGNKILYPDNINLIIIDEAHHTMCKSYIRIVNYYKDSFILGVTATPIRMDGKNLLEYFKETVNTIEIRDAINKGYLADYEIIEKKEINLDNIKIVKGEYDIIESDREVNNEKNNLFILESLKKVLKNKQAIIFANSVSHSKALERLYNEAGIKTIHLDSKTPKDVRESGLRAFKENRIQVMTNYMLFDEGIDIPDCNIVQITKPTRSISRYLQMVGRVMRPKKDKSRAIIIDNAGVIEIHGYPDEKRNWKEIKEKIEDYNDSLILYKLDKMVKKYDKEGKNKKGIYYYLKKTMKREFNDYEKEYIIKKCGFKKGFIKYM